MLFLSPCSIAPSIVCHFSLHVALLQCVPFLLPCSIAPSSVCYFSLPVALFHPVCSIPLLLTWQPGKPSSWMERPGPFPWYSGGFYLSCSVDWEKGWSFWLLYLLKSSRCVCVCVCVYMYRMVGNFREGFIFTFFASQEPSRKLKLRNFCCPRAKRANRVSIRPTSISSCSNSKRSLSASVPLTAIAQTIQEIEVLRKH